jgi:hypothetical protein
MIEVVGTGSLDLNSIQQTAGAKLSVVSGSQLK